MSRAVPEVMLGSWGAVAVVQPGGAESHRRPVPADVIEIERRAVFAARSADPRRT